MNCSVSFFFVFFFFLSSSGDLVNVVREMVESGTCPNRCSNRGTCANSICTCDTGKIYSVLFIDS